jgi:hypothetical protein
MENYEKNTEGAGSAEKDACPGNFLDYMVDTFWASLPEQTADDLAKCKKDALSWVKDTVTHLVDDEIKSTYRHVENARRMRETYRQTEPPAAESPF